jgi:small subunit ribosomal protein S16
MAVAIKLLRTGKKGYASYRIVVMDKKKKRNGAYIEKIGTYNPHEKTTKVKLNKEKLDFWLSRGAVVSEGIEKLLKRI